MDIERDIQGNLIVNGWIVEQTDQCTCGGSGGIPGDHHMPLCGYEPVAELHDQGGFRVVRS